MNSKFNVFCFLILITASIPANSAFAQDYTQRLEIPSSPVPVGSGARALGMGGAFIAIADDATAASWNPGGLFQLESPEISFVVDYFHRIEDNTFGTSPKASGDQTVYRAGINHLSVAYPFYGWNRKMVVSVNYQTLFDFTRKWNFRYMLEKKTGRCFNSEIST